MRRRSKVLLLLMTVLLLCCGCRSQRRVTMGHSAIVRQGVEVTVDSTYHPYTFRVSRYYHVPSGAVEREVLEGSGEIMRVTRSERDTVEVLVRDTVVEVREKPVYRSSGAVAGGNRNWYWWMLSGVALTVIAWSVLKLRRYGRW